MSGSYGYMIVTPDGRVVIDATNYPTQEIAEASAQDALPLAPEGSKIVLRWNSEAIELDYPKDKLQWSPEWNIGQRENSLLN